MLMSGPTPDLLTENLHFKTAHRRVGGFSHPLCLPLPLTPRLWFDPGPCAFPTLPGSRSASGSLDLDSPRGYDWLAEHPETRAAMGRGGGSVDVTPHPTPFLPGAGRAAAEVAALEPEGHLGPGPQIPVPVRRQPRGHVQHPGLHADPRQPQRAPLLQLPGRRLPGLSSEAQGSPTPDAGGHGGAEASPSPGLGGCPAPRSLSPEEHCS